MNKICKICTICKEDKPISEYHKDKGFSSGYRARCKCCVKQLRKTHYENNKERSLRLNREYMASKIPEEVKRKRNLQKQQYAKIYNVKARVKLVSAVAKYRASKIKATPAWANQWYINLFYSHAKEEEVRTGKKVHVDHIVPLRSDLVCGLHTEDNLQLLFSEDNIAKSNRVWPDMWEPSLS